MKTDTEYTYITACPKTGVVLTTKQRQNSGGVCPLCGHDNDSSFTHRKKIVGRWKRPSIVEWLKGERKEFLRKDEEDEIMAKLKGEFKADQQEGPIDDVGFGQIPPGPTGQSTRRYVDQQLQQMRDMIDGK